MFLALRCFVRITEQTAAFAVYVINWLVFITVVESVYSAVRTDYLYTADCFWSSKGQTRNTPPHFSHVVLNVMSFKFPRRCIEREDRRFVPQELQTTHHSPRYFAVHVYKESHLHRENPRFTSSVRENNTGVSAVTAESLRRSRK